MHQPKVRDWIFYFAFLISVVTFANPVMAAEENYAGLEFYGSPLITRSELESILKLRNGARSKQINSAVARLKVYLNKRRILHNIDIVSDPSAATFIVIDIEDRGAAEKNPPRNLENPHNVIVKSEKPEILLLALKARIDRLESEGRRIKITYENGSKSYDDEPANQIARELQRFGPVMRDEWLTIVRSDPDASRRASAIELLNWSGSYESSCQELINAIDDMNPEVRAAAVKFILARYDILTNEFPFRKLAAALCRQLHRASHRDRSTAIHAIKSMLSRRAELAVPMKICATEQLTLIIDSSRIKELKDAASSLLTILDSAEIPRKKPLPLPNSGF